MGRLEKYQIRMTSRSLDHFVHLRKLGHLLMDTPYQRGVVWGRRRMQNLIHSLVLGVPIASVVFNDRLQAGWADDLNFAVIDGVQRVTSILRFLDGDLVVPGAWFGYQKLEVSYLELELSTRRRFKNLSFQVAEGTLPDLETEIDVFNLINYGGIPQGEVDEDLEEL